MAIEGAEIVKAAAFIGAGISMGLGAIGPVSESTGIYSLVIALLLLFVV